jgi:hypothetical protein
MLQTCYPHLVGHIDGSWKVKFSPENRSVIIRYISFLHSCVTNSQFTRLFDLVTEAWTRLGEGDFAIFFRRMYGVESQCGGKWWVFCSGMVFITSSNNTLENYWGECKPIVALSVNMERFVNEELPKLMEHDYHHRCGVGVGSNLKSLGYRPLDYDTLGFTAVMQYENDVWEATENEFFINRPCTIGKPITQSRIDRYGDAFEGRRNIDWSSSSSRLEANDAPDNFHAATDGLCHVFRVSEKHHPDLLRRTPICDGYFCYCIKFLREGECPGVIFLMDHHCKLEPCLDDRYHYIHSNKSGSLRLRKKHRRYTVRPTFESPQQSLLASTQ